jgi:hypothetical protein
MVYSKFTQQKTSIKLFRIKFEFKYRITLILWLPFEDAGLVASKFCFNEPFSLLSLMMWSYKIEMVEKLTYQILELINPTLIDTQGIMDYLWHLFLRKIQWWDIILLFEGRGFK